MKRRRSGSTVAEVTPRGRPRKAVAPATAAGRGDATAPARGQAAPGHRPPRPEAPSRLGPYRLLEVLGEGGMGTVYLAEETENLRRRVALKWIRTSLGGQHARLRFAAERQALARMNHPSIAQIFEAGTDASGRPYIVMEHVSGGRITDYCSRRKPPPEVLLALLIDLGRGLLHAHRQGIVHRDIKPSNVLVREDPHEGPTPKIIDFGLAKLLDASVQLTRPGDVLGTPAYMAPEQLRGEAADHRSDIYSFGVLARELVAGAPGDWAAGLERIIATCVAAAPEERYSDFAVLLEDLEALRAEQRSRHAAAPNERLAGELRELFAAGAGPGAQRLLEIFEEAAADAPDLLRSTLKEAARLRDVYRRTAGARRRLCAAAADYHLGAALTGYVLGCRDEGTRACFARAAATYREVLGSAPEALETVDHLRLGDALLQLAGSAAADQAAEAYREALARDAGCVSAQYGLALASLLAGRSPDEWMGAAWRTLELAPESAPANNHLGVALYESRRHPEISLYGRDKLREAVSAFEKALAIDGQLAAVHLNLGLALHAAGAYDRAEEALRTALSLDPRSAASPRLDDLRPLEILPYSDPRPAAETYDEAAVLYRRGCAAARDDAEAARRAFVRFEQLRRQPPPRIGDGDDLPGPESVGR